MSLPLTLADARDALKARKISSTELTTAFIKAVEQARPLNAYVTETPERALAMAAASDARLAKGDGGALEGLPLAIKDLFCTKGVRTTAGSKILGNFVPPYESTVTQNLWDAGAVMLGKTNMDEFAMGSSNETSAFGPVFNPWRAKNSNANMVPGGSSGGSAAAVAGDLCLAATGTDTGGSIRQPAAVTGTVGIKPTYGRCSRFGVVAFASSLDQAGPMTKTVRDAAILLKSMASTDAKDSTSVDLPVPDYEKQLEGGIKGLRVGIPREYRIDGAPADIARLWDKGAEWLKAQGAEIVEVSLPHTKYALPTYYIVAPAEASSNLARYDGVRFGHRAKDVHGITELYEKSRAEGFGAEVQRRILIGTYVLSAGYYDAYYSRAQKLRTLIKRDFDQAFEKCDVLLTPATPGPAFGVGEKTSDPVSMYLNDVFTVTVNLAGLPGLAVPAGLTENGLPLGLQLIGKAFDEGTVLRAGLAIENAAQFKAKAAKLVEGGMNEPAPKLIKGQTGDWEVVIGMEVHAQVLSESKLFSGASTEFGAEPNSQVSFVDAGMPGMLPVINAKCIEQAVRTGLGLKAKINLRSIFDRKNYFLSDLPQGYQISQFKDPIVGEGEVVIDLAGGASRMVGIERLHLEQDAGKSLHDQHPDSSYVDLNRSGIALMEIVTKPHMRSSEEAAAFLRKLRAIVRYLGTCDGNMDEGSMRADVNVSVCKVGGYEEFRKTGSFKTLGTRCEIKNVNSMRFIAQAVEYEARRQIEIIEGGGTIKQETRLFDAKLNETRSMRSKEEAHDYRYFPDPDLLPLELNLAWVENIRKSLPELPDEKKARLMQAGLSAYDAAVLVAEREIADYFEAMVGHGADAKAAANWLNNEYFGRLNKAGLSITEGPVSAQANAEIVAMVADGTISGKIAKDVLDIEWAEKTGSPRAKIVEARGMRQVTDTSAIDAAIEAVIAANPEKVEEVKLKPKLAAWFVGQVMKQTGGKANPASVNVALKLRLNLPDEG